MSSIQRSPFFPESESRITKTTILSNSEVAINLVEISRAKTVVSGDTLHRRLHTRGRAEHAYRATRVMRLTPAFRSRRAMIWVETRCHYTQSRRSDRREKERGKSRSGVRAGYIGDALARRATPTSPATRTVIRRERITA